MTLSETQASRHPDDSVEAFAPLAPGFPPLPRSPSLHAVLTTPVDRPGACRLLIGALPRRVLPSPLWPSRNERPVGIHIFSFEACSSYHSRYGLQSCSPTLRGLCHEAPTQPVTLPSRSSATKAYRQLLGWVLPPLVICAIEAHVRFNNFHKWGDRDPAESAGIRNYDPARALKTEVVLATFIQLSTTNDREATRVDENGWPSAVFDNSGTRPFTLFNFQRSVKHYRRHLTVRTAGFRTAPRILFTRQRALGRGLWADTSRVATIIQHAYLA